LKVSITDDGVAFDPFTLASPDLDAPAEEQLSADWDFISSEPL